MNEYQRPRAVLDSDIIFSRVLHELMGRIAAELRLLDLFWSEQLLAEAQRSLVEKKRLPVDSARRWVDYLRLSFPAGCIDLDLQPPDVAELTRDPADAHVCALVVAAHADYLFTHDRGYLRDGLSRHGVQVLTPDEFLADVLASDAGGVLGYWSCRRAPGPEGTWSGSCSTLSSAPAWRPSRARRESSSDAPVHDAPRGTGRRRTSLKSRQPAEDLAVACGRLGPRGRGVVRAPAHAARSVRFSASPSSAGLRRAASPT